MLTFAFCTYNRADRLENLVAAMRAQSCPIPFEILAINNNSTDRTKDVLVDLAEQPGPILRWVTEHDQGIVPSRNRAIEESINSSIMVFIDDDEIPLPGLLDAVVHAILKEGAQCTGGRIAIDFSTHPRPAWLDSELIGFLGALDHGDESFWIVDESTPIWSGNVAYDMSLLRDNTDLRFDKRYDRKGTGVGGGSDAIMFRSLIDRNTRIRYSPNMAILHSVDPWKLRRSYFLKLHYRSGLRQGRYQLPEYPRTVFGMPPFLIAQFLKQSMTAIARYIVRSPGSVRDGMNAANALGLLLGYVSRVRGP